MKEVAHKLEYIEDHYRKFELGIGNNRFVSTLEFLAKIASLENMKLKKFIHYLFPNDKLEGRNNLFPWEISLIKAFMAIPPKARAHFTHGICQDSFKNCKKNKRFQDIIEFSIIP